MTNIEAKMVGEIRAARVRAKRLVGAAGSSDGGSRHNDDKCDDVCSVAGGSHRPTARLAVPREVPRAGS